MERRVLETSERKQIAGFKNKWVEWLELMDKKWKYCIRERKYETG